MYYQILLRGPGTRGCEKILGSHLFVFYCIFTTKFFWSLLREVHEVPPSPDSPPHLCLSMPVVPNHCSTEPSSSSVLAHDMGDLSILFYVGIFLDYTTKYVHIFCKLFKAKWRIIPIVWEETFPDLSKGLKYIYYIFLCIAKYVNIAYIQIYYRKYFF